ncbi:MAG: KEOPS complex subunit Pcc1 [Candidatus Caldarchaeales archaeon]
MQEDHGHPSRKGKNKAEIKIDLPREEREIILKSVSTEIREIPSRRTRVDLCEAGESIKLTIYAEDIVALRAALNSFLRFIDASLRTLRLIDVIQNSRKEEIYER